MKSQFTRFVVGGVVALSLFGAVSVAQASALSTTQISAIVSLLQAFGADQSTIAQVSATLYGQPTAPTSPVVSVPASCANFSDLKRGDSDARTGGRVSQLQQYLGIYPTTGTYGPLTQIGFGNKCIGGNSQPAAIAGMSKYTDSDFGFSFWYPSGWSVSPEKQYTSTPEYLILDQNGLVKIRVEEYTRSSMRVGNDLYGYDTYYFDSSARSWMDSVTKAANGSPDRTIPADISNNTMGGLHMFSGGARFGAATLIPLSASHFVMVTTDSDPGTLSQTYLAKTIVATDPTVATPVPTAQQIQTIQAEASAYGVSTYGVVGTNTSLQTYTNSDYGFSVSYDPSIFKTYTNSYGYMGKPDYTNTLLSLFYGAGSITFRGDKTTTYEDCLKNSADTKTVTPTVINGITFYRSSSGDVGLGHSLSVDTYRTYYNGACYAIHTWIESDRTGDGSSYTDTTKEKKNLQDVLSTFTFIVPQTQPALHASVGPDWKTYIGTGMPVSFAYPGNYVIQETADTGYGNEINITTGSKVGLDIVPGDPFTSAITIQKNLITSNNTLQKNLDFDAGNKQNYYRPIMLGGVSGFFGGDINGPGLTNQAVINLQKGNYTYRILLYGPFPANMYSNFVNSFKFIN